RDRHRGGRSAARGAGTAWPRRGPDGAGPRGGGPSRGAAALAVPHAHVDRMVGSRPVGLGPASATVAGAAAGDGDRSAPAPGPERLPGGGPAAARTAVVAVGGPRQRVVGSRAPARPGSRGAARDPAATGADMTPEPDGVGDR